MKHIKLFETHAVTEGTEPEVLITMNSQTEPGLLKFVNSEPSITSGTWKKKTEDTIVLTSGKVSVAIMGPPNDLRSLPTTGTFKIIMNTGQLKNIDGYIVNLYK